MAVQHPGLPEIGGHFSEKKKRLRQRSWPSRASRKSQGLHGSTFPPPPPDAKVNVTVNLTQGAWGWGWKCWPWIAQPQWFGTMKLVPNVGNTSWHHKVGINNWYSNFGCNSWCRKLGTTIRYSGYRNYNHPHGLQRGVNPGCQTGCKGG